MQAISPWRPLPAAVQTLTYRAASPEAVCEPTDTADISSLPNPWTRLKEAGMMGAFSALPSPLGGVLEGATRDELLATVERLQQDGVQFVHRRAFKLPGMDPTVTLSPEKVVERLAAGDAERIEVKAPDDNWPSKLDSLAVLYRHDLAHHGLQVAGPEARETLRILQAVGADERTAARVATNLALGQTEVEFSVEDRRYRLRSPEDFTYLDYFQGTGQSTVARPEVAHALREAERAGFELVIQTRGFYADGAYRIMQYGHPEENLIQVGRQGPRVPLSRLQQPEGLRQDVELFTAEYQRFVAGNVARARLQRYEVPQELDLALAQGPARLRLEMAVYGGLLGACLDAQPRWEELRSQNLVPLDMKDPSEVAARLYRLVRETPQPEALTGALIPIIRREGGARAVAQAEAIRRGLEESAPPGRLRDRANEIFAALFSQVPSVQACLEGVDLVQIGVGEESVEQRQALFQQIGAVETDPSLTSAHYRAVLAHRVTGESLERGAARMVTLLKALKATDQQRGGASVFAAVNARAGGDSGRADSLALDFARTLVTTSSLAQAVESIQAGDYISIQQEEGLVRVGDFALEVNS